ncbi:MAG: MASE3 domain-containing protein [Spirochaetia bacterium]
MESTALPGLSLRPEVKVLRTAVCSLAVVLGLLLASRFSYLLFHSLAEIFSISVACAVFMISWSSRGYLEAKPFVLLGIGYLGVAVLDCFHMLSYRGMGVLANQHDDATRLWIAARALQAAVTLAFALLARRRAVSPALAFTLVGSATVLALLSVFWWDNFPLCFVEGVGVTPFKKGCEYAISAVFALSLYLVARNPDTLNLKERWLLCSSCGLTIMSELVLTLYVSAYGYQNLIGHFLKIGAFFLAYQALFSGKIRGRLALIGELERAKVRLEANEMELRKANLSKDKFFSILAHDLRNPIGGLVSISELLARRFDELEPSKVRDLCALLHDGALQSAELLECILQWARAQTGRLEVRPTCIRIGELCEGIMELQSSAAASKEIRIASQVSLDAAAYADENMVATVLRNLVSNAVKFTPRGGQVVLSAEKEGDWQLVSVSDTGVGMSREELEKLFRIDVHFSCPGTESEKGNGMGLILCKELVELNRGGISVVSEPMRGSTFSFRLPRSAAAAVGRVPGGSNPEWLLAEEKA